MKTRYVCVWDWYESKFKVFMVVGEEKDGFFVGNFDDRVKTLFNCGHYGSRPGIEMQWVAVTRKGAVGKRRKDQKRIVKDYEQEVAAAKTDLALLDKLHGGLL